MELSKRLREIVALVPQKIIVADIGTDHALLPVYLIEKGIATKVIASDINLGPFDSARQAVIAKGLQDKIDVRLGDGLDVLSPGEAQAVVIAGMGGNTIRKVLAAFPETVSLFERLILQPMNDAYDLRCWLIKNGWCLVDEKLVAEGERLYVIIAVEPCSKKTLCENTYNIELSNIHEITLDSVSKAVGCLLTVSTGVDDEHPLYSQLTSELLLEIGPCLLKKNDPNLPLLLQKMLNDYMMILKGLAKSHKPESKAKAQSIENKLSAIREVLEKCL